VKIPSWILLVALLVLAIVPLIVAQGAEFGGVDGEAEVAITEIQPHYAPWFSPIWEPPSGEIESALFAVQAAAGAAFIAYVLGYRRGRRRGGPA
jgi:cobalt/nickel transport protein